MKAFFPFILIIIAIGLFFFQINPLYTKVKELRAEAREYDEALRTADKLKEIRTELSARLESFPKAQLERLDHFLPRRLDTIRVILDTDGIAARNGVRIENMSVSDSSPKDGKESGAPGISYNVVDVSFSFSSTYAQGVQFIQDIQRSLRLMDVVGMTVKSSSKTAISSDVFYDFDLKLQGYWVNR